MSANESNDNATPPWSGSSRNYTDLGWEPVDMIEPATGWPFTRWHPPSKTPPGNRI